MILTVRDEDPPRYHQVCQYEDRFPYVLAVAGGGLSTPLGLAFGFQAIEPAAVRTHRLSLHEARFVTAHGREGAALTRVLEVLGGRPITRVGDHEHGITVLVLQEIECRLVLGPPMPDLTQLYGPAQVFVVPSGQAETFRSARHRRPRRLAAKEEA